MSILTVITASISRCLDLTFFGVTPAKMGPEWPLSERRDFLAKLGVSIPLSGALIAAEMPPAKSQSSMMMTPQEIFVLYCSEALKHIEAEGLRTTKGSPQRIMIEAQAIALARVLAQLQFRTTGGL